MDFFDGSHAGELLEEVDFDGVMDGIAGDVAHVGAAESDGVAALDAAVLHEAKRRDVLCDGIAAADHRETADTNKLVDHDTARNDGVLRDSHAARQQRGVGDDDIVGDLAVVAEMDECHEHDVVADDRMGVGLRAAVDGDVFTDAAVFADIDVTDSCIVETDVLRLVSDDGSSVDFSAVADGRVSRQMDMGADLAVVADGDVFINDGVRRDINVVSDFGTLRDDGSWVYAHDDIPKCLWVI